MDTLILKKEIVDKIQNDGILFGRVADALGIKPVTLPRTLLANSPRLTQANVLRILKEHLQIENESDLLDEEIRDNDNTQNAHLQAITEKS